MRTSNPIVPNPYPSIAVILAIALSACASTTSTAQTASRRTADLRAEFPPDRATRADVIGRLGHTPEITWRRPLGGWTNPFVVEAERRLATPIFRAEEYVSPTLTSAYAPTLEHAWFFFDADDVVLDAVWQRMGD